MLASNLTKLFENAMVTLTFLHIPEISSMALNSINSKILQSLAVSYHNAVRAGPAGLAVA